MTTRMQYLVRAGSLALSLTTLAACDDPDATGSEDPVAEEATVERAGVMPTPVGLWHLDESCASTLVSDDSGQAAHGQRIGGTSCVAGKTDLAAGFDGVDDRIEVADRPAFHFTTQMTAAAWVRPTSTTGLRTILNKWYALDAYALYIADGKYNFSVAVPDGGWGAHHDISAPATAGVWAHVAGVYDGQTLSLYINGALAATKTIATQPTALQDSARPLVIGNHPGQNAFVGQIDEVRLYGVSLTAAQVKSLTRNEYYVATTGLDSNPGTRAKPFRTLAKGGQVAQVGDTVYVRGGVYNVGTAGEPVVKLDNLGTAAEHIVFRAYPGETAVLDGSLAPAGTDLMQVRGAYYDIVGLELAHAQKIAISMYRWDGPGGQHINIVGNHIHHSRKGAVYPGTGSKFMRFEDNHVHHNVQENQTKTLYCHNGGWPSTVNLTGEGDVVVGNTIHENWGEGIGAYGSGHVITDNVLHDNYSVDIYFNNIEGSLLARNFVYSDPDAPASHKRLYYPDGQGCPLQDPEACKCSALNKVAAAAVGIGLANEDPAAVRLGDNRVINNIVVGARRSGIQLTCWSGSGPCDMQDTLIAHNTVVCAAESEVLRIKGGTPVSDGVTGTIADNIFYQQRSDRRLAQIGHAVDIVFAGNNWFGGNGTAFPLGVSPTDVPGDPKLVAAQGSDPAAPGDYMLTASSPNIDAAAAIAGPAVTQDYFGDPRPTGPAADIGAHEFTP